MENSQTPAQQLKTMNILWMAMSASVLIYHFIAFLQIDNPARLAERSPIANMIWAFAVAFAGMGIVLPRMLFANASPTIQLTSGYITRYAMFETVAICALINFLTQGVPYAEAALGMTAAFALMVFSKPRLA